MFTRALFFPILACLGLFTARAQDNQTAKKPESVPVAAGASLVTGRAVFEDTGQPAARYRVQLIASEFFSAPHARFRIPTQITNDDGVFNFRSIAAGEYYVFTQPIDEHKPSAQVFPFFSGGVIEVAKVEQFKKDCIRIAVDGQSKLVVNLRVVNRHFGSISGRVIDALGQPAVRTSVHLMSKGEHPFGANVLTDEQGEFKFYGLSEGEYVISASPPASSSETEPIRRYEGVLGATYFPSTLESRNSPPVTVFADRDTGNIDIRLISRSLHSLTGIVRKRGDNHPVSNATVRLTRTQTSSGSSSMPRTPDIERAMSIYISATDGTGHWSIANVPDGVYRLQVANEPTKQLFVQEEVTLKVEGADLENLLVEVSDGSRVSGVVSIEGDGPSPQWVNLHASRLKGNASTYSRLEGPGPFTLTAVPAGEIALSASPVPQDKFYVKSIEANGLDLLHANLTIAEGEEIKDVRIVISPNVGTITGRVLSLNGDKPVEGINVLLRRVSNDQLRSFGGKLSGVTDAQGNFILSAAPGTYLVLAWRAVDGPSAFGDAMNRAVQDQGAGLTLLPNDRKQLDIRVP